MWSMSTLAQTGQTPITVVLRLGHRTSPFDSLVVWRTTMRRGCSHALRESNAFRREGYAMQEYPPQPKQEFWQPQLESPYSPQVRQPPIMQARPPKKRQRQRKKRRDRTACIVFSLVSAAAVVVMLTLGLMAVLVIGLVIILNIVVWLRS